MTVTQSQNPGTAPAPGPANPGTAPGPANPGTAPGPANPGTAPGPANPGTNPGTAPGPGPAGRAPAGHAPADGRPGLAAALRPLAIDVGVPLGAYYLLRDALGVSLWLSLALSSI